MNSLINQELLTNGFSQYELTLLSGAKSNCVNNTATIATQDELKQCIKHGVTKNLHVTCKKEITVINADEMENHRDIETWTFADNAFLLFRKFKGVALHLNHGAAKRCKFEECVGCDIKTSCDIQTMTTKADEHEVLFVDCSRVTFVTMTQYDHVNVYGCKQCYFSCKYTGGFLDMNMCEFNVTDQKIKAKTPFMSCHNSIVTLAHCTITAEHEFIHKSHNNKFVFNASTLLLKYRDINLACEGDECRNNKFTINHKCKRYVLQTNDS